ncbi:hypothetical protein GCM10007103_09370 [Salinimicrobium marinum]|uniref:asparagine synthase (glutamine-hydrolyzing) n=1 Tax=Salinimicrobium marinum TaxID=680283 RepID=A0A918SB70_9FLAO|nr:asparagine synthase [Salinimicrobium marinum]GHA30185.1 hypothetical protein GCM10007103_09370 [Salinimicrobium marinum]
MPGFNLSTGVYRFPEKEKLDHIFYESISRSEYAINRFTLKKFINDKIFYDDEHYIIILDGVVLNKNFLVQEGENWEKAVIRLYKAHGETFFNNFRGSFTGAIYEKKEEKWIIFNDHLGSKHLYYFLQDDKIYISSEIRDLYSLFKGCSIEYHLDQQATYMLLSYGYMLDNHTLCTEIKKLEPGSFVRVQNNKIDIEKYYTLPLAPKEDNRSTSELIDGIDQKFKAAIKLQFDKDLEYGHSHLVALSGGLDSRMTSWVAHQMGYKDQINFTFSQSNYLDETIPKKIAADLKHEWIFKALDNGIFLKDLDEINRISGGNVLYYTLAHGNSMFKLLNLSNLGLVHSGQIGDIVISSFIKDFNNLEISGVKAYSKKFLDKIERPSPVANNIEEKEGILIYRRGLNGANNGLLIYQDNTETMSPFYDIDFFEYCLSIPIERRKKHQLYIKWVTTKYPEAAKYVWETTKKPVSTKEVKPIIIPIGGKKIPLKSFLPLFLHKTGIKKQKKKKKKSKEQMNPLDYWYETNNDIKEFQDQYFNQTIHLLDKNKKMKQEITELYTEGTAIEKNQVLTLLSAIKLFF